MFPSPRTVPWIRSTPVVSSIVSLMICGPAPAHSAANHAAHAGHRHASTMSDAAMKREVEAWFASHPRVGKSSLGGPADTFTVTSFRFDTDGNASTQTDTAFISVGETILWRLVSGFHTTTNGEDGSDENAGTLWDRPIDAGNPQFSFQFNAAGVYPFFCRPHESLMKGVVVVQAPTVVPPPNPQRIGFLQGPSPNPTRTGVSYRFALARPGAVRIEVFDEHGRRVAVVQSASLDAGVHAGAWNGRGANGSRAASGTYFMRLRGPGVDQSRSFTIAR